jgi:CDP-glycerol glycerophosphotransferase (TagB/SpsB family)
VASVSWFGSANLAKVKALPLYLFGEVAARLVSRRADEWVVGSAFGVHDGARAVVEEAMRRTHPPRITWLGRSEDEMRAARSLGVDALSHGGLRAFMRSLRAGVIIVTHGYGDASRFATHGAFVVQLWHGAPLKRLHLDSAAVMELSNGATHRWLRRVLAAGYRRGGRRVGLFPVGSPFVQPLIAGAFGVRADRVEILGEPRTDVLFAGDERDRRAEARQRLNDLLGPIEARVVVLFAPTWRDGAEDPVVPTADEWRRIEAVMEEIDAVLLVRPHPLSQGGYSSSAKRVRLLSPTVAPDLNRLLPAVDALVTDYSSVLVDAAALAIPVVFLAPDHEEYAATRGLYVSYDETSAGRVDRTWPEALDRLRSLVRPGPDRDEALAHSARLADRYHVHRDGRSAQRVVERVLGRATAGPSALRPGRLRALRRS